MNNQRSLKILQHNVRTWHLHRFALYNIYRHIDPDLIILNSHGNTDAQRIKLYNYTVLQTNLQQTQHDGAAIAVRNSIPFQRVHGLSRETLAVEVGLEFDSVVVATLYNPPRRNNLPTQDILRLANLNKPMIILADFNARHRFLGTADTNAAGAQLHRIRQANKLNLLGPEFPTFYGYRNPSTPDRVFGNNLFAFNTHFTPGPPTTSDHLPIVATISVEPIQIPIAPRFAYRRADWARYQDLLQTYEGGNLEGEVVSKIDEEWDRLLEAITTARDATTPVMRHRRLPPIYITPTIRRLRRQLAQLIEQLRLNINYALNYRKYIQLGSTLREEYRTGLTATWNSLVSRVDLEDPKDFWTQISRMRGTNRFSPTKDLKDEQGRRLLTDYDKTTAFRRRLTRTFQISDAENQQFNEVVERAITNHVTTQEHLLIPQPTVPQETPPGTPQMTPGMVKDIIISFKDRAPGPSTITRSMLLHLPPAIIQVMTRLYNYSLASGYFPLPFKKAKVVMVPKQGKNLTQIENHRPISLLEVPGKIFEKYLNQRLMLSLETEDLLQPLQHGFRRGRGTATAIALATEFVAHALSHGGMANIVLRDVRGAFDKVWHLGLKNRLLSLQCHPNIVRLLSHFLDDRTGYSNTLTLPIL